MKNYAHSIPPNSSNKNKCTLTLLLRQISQKYLTSPWTYDPFLKIQTKGWAGHRRATGENWDNYNRITIKINKIKRQTKKCQHQHLLNTVFQMANF